MSDKNSNSWFPCLAPYLISKAFKLSLFCVQLACLSTTSLVKLRKNSFSYNWLRILWHELMLILLNISAFIMPNLIKFFTLHVIYRLFCNVSSVSTTWHFWTVTFTTMYFQFSSQYTAEFILIVFCFIF